MKYPLTLLLFLIGPFTHLALAQDEEKTWIFFTDKVSVAGKAAAVEAGYISAKALERRQRRGINLSPIHDVPISSVYLNALKEEGIEVVRRSRWLNAVSAYLTADQRDMLEQWPFVAKLRRVATLAPDIRKPAPVPPMLAHPRSRRLDCGDSCGQLDLINAITPLENGINGRGVIFGILDTRFDYENTTFGHPATAHLAKDGRVRYRNFTADDPGVGSDLDPNFHGIFTSAVALSNAPGELIGPCYGADTVYAAHTEWAPLERNVEEDNFVAGVEWMEASGVDIINASLTYKNFDAGEERQYEPSDMDGDTGVTTIAFDMAAQKGVVPVAAAGNSGGGDFWSTVGSPADGDSVITVGGVGPDRVALGFSSTGPSADGRTKPDVVAQAGAVYTAYISNSEAVYTYLDGTSLSSPIVAGVACQVLQVNPDLNPKEVWGVLTATASQSANPDNKLGWGIIDAQAAIDSARALTSTAITSPPSVPSSFVVHPPYPNPFREEAQFLLELPNPASNVRIAIYNALGQRVLTPHTGPLGAGTHTIRVQAHRIPAGLYTFVVKADGAIRTGLMVHIR